MARRVWIIAKKDKIEDNDIASAQLNGCAEIANGIPPALEGIISKFQLPIAYEEPEVPPPPKPRDLEAELDDLKAKVKELEKK